MFRRLQIRDLPRAVAPAASWLAWAATLPLILACAVAYVVLGLVIDFFHGGGPGGEDGPDEL